MFTEKSYYIIYRKKKKVNQKRDFCVKQKTHKKKEGRATEPGEYEKENNLCKKAVALFTH